MLRQGCNVPKEVFQDMRVPKTDLRVAGVREADLRKAMFYFIKTLLFKLGGCPGLPKCTSEPHQCSKRISKDFQFGFNPEIELKSKAHGSQGKSGSTPWAQAQELVTTGPTTCYNRLGNLSQQAWELVTTGPGNYHNRPGNLSQQARFRTRQQKQQRQQQQRRQQQQ